MHINVYVWPDGFWCEEHELEQCQKGRSDDFAKLQVPPTVGDTDFYVEQYLAALHCTKLMPKWELKKQIHGCHKIFRDEVSGRYAICDYSGLTPDKTNDGVLWIDTQLPLIHSENKWGVPLLTDAGAHSSTLANDDEARWLIENLQMTIQLGGALFYPYKDVPVIPRKDNVGDVSTCHITAGDSVRLQSELVPAQIGKFEYGYVVITHPRTNTERTEKLREAQMSEAYIRLLNLAYASGFHYLMIDQDGPEVEGLETFEW